ncbi:MAG: amino acid permease [Nitrospinota bacterium]
MTEQSELKIREDKRVIGFFTATSLVIANMIGTGVFMTLGFQTVNINSHFSLLFSWIIGGIIAICGALSYGELASAMPRSGGEYYYLFKIYHPAIGFLSGWVSATVGFSAPIALSAMALGEYFSRVYYVPPVVLASTVVIVFSVLHAINVKIGSLFHNLFTLIKVFLILFFIISASFTNKAQDLNLKPSLEDIKIILSPAFAVSLIYVFYAYLGWNASTYIASEVKNPEKNLPKSLLIGTLIVVVLYLALNYAFLYTVPTGELVGHLEIGYLSANKIFGESGGKIMSIIISLALLSTVSSMIITGPRITQAIGEDIPFFKPLSIRFKDGGPVYAIIIQLVISLFFIITSTFEKTLTYTGFTLSLFTTLTVIGVFLSRIRNPDLPRPYKTSGYPFTSLIFLILSLWMMTYTLIERPVESFMGLITAFTGLIVYYLAERKGNKDKAIT